jgi:hypothetical protein
VPCISNLSLSLSFFFSFFVTGWHQKRKNVITSCLPILQLSTYISGLIVYFHYFALTPSPSFLLNCLIPLIYMCVCKGVRIITMMIIWVCTAASFHSLVSQTLSRPQTKYPLPRLPLFFTLTLSLLCGYVDHFFLLMAFLLIVVILKPCEFIHCEMFRLRTSNFWVKLQLEREGGLKWCKKIDAEKLPGIFFSFYNL